MRTPKRKLTGLILGGILLQGLACSLGGCGNDSSGGGGGGGGSSPPPSGSANVSGTAIANTVSGATVTVVAVKPDGTSDGTLCTGTTDANGAFSIADCSAPPSGDGVRIEISNGSYSSEADTSKTVSGTALSILLANIGGASGITITPLTTFSDSAASAAMAKGGGDTPVASYIAAADASISKIYGLPSGTDLSTLAPDFTATSGAGAETALVLGTLEQLAINVGKSPADVLTAIASDLGDGVPDGKAADGSPVVYGDGTPAPNTLANSDLLSALNNYLGSSTTILKKDSTTLASSTVDSVRGGVVAATPSSFALNIGSSGAVTELVTGGKQLVIVAARSAGVQEIDITNPAAPVVNGLSTLNTAIQALSTPFGDVGGVLAVPGGSGNEVALFNYNAPRLVVVDVTTQKVVSDLDLTSKLPTLTSFSGGDAYISGGISDFTRNLIWLATGDGYFPYDPSTNSVGAPIPLAATQIVAENIGGATDPSNNLLFSPNYGPQGSGGGLQLVDLAKDKAYAMNDTQFQSDFGIADSDIGDGSTYPFGIADSGAFDNVYKVGVMIGEDVNYVGFLDMHDPSKFTYDDSTCGAQNDGCGFKLTVPTVAKTLILTPADGSSYYEFAGSAIDSTSHLLLGMAGYSNDFLVAKLDNPAAPAGAAWAGFTSWKYYEASDNEFSYAQDPHAVGVLQSTANGKSYGFVLSSIAPAGEGSSVAMVDGQAFLSAAAESSDPHQLASTPFNGAIIKTLTLSTNSAEASAIAVKAVKTRIPQRHYGTTVRTH